MYKTGDIMWIEDSTEGHVPFLIVFTLSTGKDTTYHGFYLATLPEDFKSSKTIKEVLIKDRKVEDNCFNGLTKIVNNKILPDIIELYLYHVLTEDEFERKLTLKEHRQLVNEYEYI